MQVRGLNLPVLITMLSIRGRSSYMGRFIDRGGSPGSPVRGSGLATGRHKTYTLMEGQCEKDLH